MKDRGRRKVRRVYGHSDADYDQLFGLFKSKHKKKKESLDIKQRDANLNLTNKQNEIAAAKAQAEVFRAQAEQMKALSAKKLAEKADAQLRGAKATTNLKYVTFGLFAVVGVAAVAFAIYMVKQGKKSALIKARVQKAQLAGAA